MGLTGSRVEKGKTKISAAGSLNRVRNISGFTLIELIVVISIISMLLVFSLPVFRDIGLFPDSGGQVGDMVRLINDLKKRAIEQDLDFQMHVDTGTGKIWVTHEAMDNGAKEAAKDDEAGLSKDILVSDVEFPGIRKTSPGEFEICFRKQGYSDFALIHIIDDETHMTIKVEPFLSQVQVLDGHVYLDDCI
jgi:prepilin-type N-terminal cleavage/methylation domain-containing protein